MCILIMASIRIYIYIYIYTYIYRSVFMLSQKIHGNRKEILMHMYIWGWAEMFIWIHHILCCRVFWPVGSKHCNTNGRCVLTIRRIMLKNEPYLIVFPTENLIQSMNFFSYFSNINIIKPAVLKKIDVK